MNLQKGLFTLKRIVSQKIAHKSDTFSLSELSDDKSENTQFKNLQIQSILKCNIQNNMIDQYQKSQKKFQQINSLNLQSKIKQEEQPFAELPLQCNQSKLKLKVHSSIDGKLSQQRYEVNSSKSIPLSDLILTDNGYQHLFVNKNAQNVKVNRHQLYQNEIQILQEKYKNNLKLIKQQTQQHLKIIQQALYLENLQQNIGFLNQKILQLQDNIKKIKNQKKNNNSLTLFKSKQKSPDLTKIKSFKLFQSPIFSHKNQQNLKFKLNFQRQKSIKLQTKLVQVKNHHKMLQNKLNQRKNSNSKDTSAVNMCFSPKYKYANNSPNYKKSIQKNLQIQKINYFQTLKRKKEVIQESITTFKTYTETRNSQLVRQIKALKKQNSYLSSKTMLQGDYYCSPKAKNIPLDLFREKSKYKNSIFSTNNSQKLITVSSTKSIYPWKQSPRSPQPRSPQSIYIKALNKQNWNGFKRSSNSKSNNQKQLSMNSSRSKNGRRAFLMRDVNRDNKMIKNNRKSQNFRQLLDCIKNEINTQPSDQYYMSQNEYKS